MAVFEIKKATNGEYFFHLLATSSNENILHSETYESKSGCNNGIDSVKKNAPDDHRYARLTSTNEKYYFNLKAGNGEIIGTSSMYATSAERDRVIELVKAQAPTAGTSDLT